MQQENGNEVVKEKGRFASSPIGALYEQDLYVLVGGWQ